MRNVIISEEQLRSINNSGVRDIPEFMLDAISRRGTSLKASNCVSEEFLIKCAKARYDEICGNFSDDITSYPPQKVLEKLSKLFRICQHLEKGLAPQLESICHDAVVKAFGIPDDALEVECHIKETIPDGKLFHVKAEIEGDKEYDSVSAIESEELEIDKRRVINALVYGAAKRFSGEIMKTLTGEVFELSEELPHLYSQIMKINEYLVFTNDIQIEDKSHKQGGYVEATLSNGERPAKIESCGIAFPILLQETVRGVAEVIASHGLPDDVNGTNDIINVCDALEFEPWNMRLGPALWDLFDAMSGGISIDEFAGFFSIIVQIDADEFVELFKEVFAKTRRGKEMLGKIKANVKYTRDYGDFEKDLDLRRSQTVIADQEYFTQEELEN